MKLVSYSMPDILTWKSCPNLPSKAPLRVCTFSLMDIEQWFFKRMRSHMCQPELASDSIDPMQGITWTLFLSYRTGKWVNSSPSRYFMSLCLLLSDHQEEEDAIACLSSHSCRILHFLPETSVGSVDMRTLAPCDSQSFTRT